MNVLLFTTLTAALRLAACATPESTQPAGRPLENPISYQAAVVPSSYGLPTSFLGNKLLRYPHFDLIFLGTTLDQSRSFPAHLLRFQARNSSGRAVALFTWHPASGDSDSFFLDGRRYQFTVDVDTLQISVFPGN